MICNFAAFSGEDIRAVTDTKPFEWGSRLPTLKTPRLTLRALAEPDVADVFAVFSDPGVMRYWDSAAMTTLLRTR